MKDKIKENLATIIAIGTIIAMVVGAQAYFAKAKDLERTNFQLKLTNMRLQQKIREDVIRDLYRRKWQLEMKYNTPCGPSWDKKDLEEYRKIEMDLEKLKKERDSLIEFLLTKENNEGE